MARQLRRTRQADPAQGDVEPMRWARLAFDAAALTSDMAQVMGLRTAKLWAGGPGAHREAWTMVAEKWQAGAEWQAQMIACGPDASPIDMMDRTMRLYRRKVAANRRRLS